MVEPKEQQTKSLGGAECAAKVRGGEDATEGLLATRRTVGTASAINGKSGKEPLAGSCQLTSILTEYNGWTNPTSIALYF